MILQYVNAAMRHAHYEFLSEDKQYYGEISDCKGVYATANTLEECREELEEVFEDWILFRVYRNLDLPVIGGVELVVKEAV